jgi:hypothetical protein
MKIKNNLLSKIIAVTQLKWILPALIALTLGVAVLGVAGCKQSGPEHSGEHAHQYTCPMHPEVVKDAPGDCPSAA